MENEVNFNWRTFNDFLLENQDILDYPQLEESRNVYVELSTTVCQKCKKQFVKVLLDAYKSLPTLLTQEDIRVIKEKTKATKLIFLYEESTLFSF